MPLASNTPAPDFTVNDQDGNEISLHDFRGKKVVLYFYPKDDTPGCTAQACNLRDNLGDLKARGIEVLGVSTDDTKSHKKFEDKFNLTFPLLADVDHKIVNDYGVWGPKKFMGKDYMGTSRVTYLINEAGTIEHVLEKVDTKDHARQVLDTWGMQ